MKLARLSALLLAVSGWPLAAQTPTFDSSGNGLLKGTYYFREVLVALADVQGSIADSVVLYGNISFGGDGTYTMTGASALVASSGFGSLSHTGTYSISASGYGFISHPFLSGVSIFGVVSQKGILVASSTESGYNDLFVAAPLSSPSPTNATLKGSYSVSNMDFTLDLSQGNPLYTLSSLFQMNADGAGNIGTVAVTGYLGGSGSTVYSQTSLNVKYAFTNGAASLTFPTTSSATLISGQKFLYISPDGNFVFGGSPNGFDMFVGVRTGSGTPNLSGLYYQAGIDEDFSALSNTGYTYLESYFGAFSANAGSIVSHQRRQDEIFDTAYDYTSSDVYTVKSDGTYSTPQMRYVVGADGTRIGSGIGPFIGLNVALPAPSLTGPGVFLNPQGVVNAASNAPFTAGIAPGEFLALYGTNLANDTAVASDLPFPSTLAGVQLLINGVPAPLSFVSPGFIKAIVPYGATTPVVQLQVNNNGVLSNVVTNFTSLTSPGIFTASQTGLGAGAVLHADYSLVTSDHPAQIGETVSVFLTGLGVVDPAIPDGSIAPSDPLSKTVNTISAFVGGVPATVVYAGLAPALAGLYQVNLTIPAGLTAGDNGLDISGSALGATGPDSYTQEATIAVAAAAASASLPAVPLATQPVASRVRKSSAPVLRRSLGQTKGSRRPGGQ